VSLGREVGLGPGHIVLDEEDPAPPTERAQLPPFFGRLCSGQSPISATAELLYWYFITES